MLKSTSKIIFSLYWIFFHLRTLPYAVSSCNFCELHDFIYNLEYVEEQMIQQRIENEEYGLHTMAPDDDDYGDMDGDEYY